MNLFLFVALYVLFSYIITHGYIGRWLYLRWMQLKTKFSLFNNFEEHYAEGQRILEGLKKELDKPK